MRFLLLSLVMLVSGCATQIHTQPLTVPVEIEKSLSMTLPKLRSEMIPMIPPSRPAPVVPPATALKPPALPPAPPPVVIPTVEHAEVAKASAVDVKQQIKKQVPKPKENPVPKISDQMIKANMVFSLDEQRNINETVQAQLLIGLATNGDLSVSSSSGGIAVRAKIDVGRIIIADLTATDFDVKLKGVERQPLVEDRNLVWEWELKPKKAGTFPITLVVISEFDVGQGKEKITLESYRRTIEITITKYQIMKLWFIENWKWLSTTVVIPVIVWLWNRRSKKRSANKTAA